jgi:hypothetical protein
LRIADCLDYTRRNDVEIDEIRTTAKTVELRVSTRESILDLARFRRKAKLFEQVLGFKVLLSFSNQGI